MRTSSWSSPNEAVARLVRAESVRARGAVARLESLAEALEITAVQPSPGDGATIDGELVADERIPERLAGWIHHTSGELMWLRPDQWQLPDHRELANAIRQAHLAGRRVRAIYPVQALHDAPEILRQRARIGERIRVAPVVTLRLAVIGQRALVQEPRGHARLSRIVLRQPVLVDILRDFFQQAWDRAVPVPELALGDPEPISAGCCWPSWPPAPKTSRSPGPWGSVCARSAGGWRRC